MFAVVTANVPVLFRPIPTLFVAALASEPTVILSPIARAFTPYAVAPLPIAIPFSVALRLLPNAIPPVSTVLSRPKVIP